MARKKVDSEVDVPYISIEEDMRLLDMAVQHDGMSRQAAQSLVRKMRREGLQASLAPLTTEGEYHDSPSYVPRANKNTYTDVRYNVAVIDGTRVRVVRNKQEWELYRHINLPDTPKQSGIDLTEVDEFAEDAGVSIEEAQAFLQGHKTELEREAGRLTAKPTEDGGFIAELVKAYSPGDTRDMIPAEPAARAIRSYRGLKVA